MPPAPDLLARDYGTVAYVLSPYLWVGGITLLLGKTSAGQSPLSWSMARAVASGTPWVGHPGGRGPGLYGGSDSGGGAGGGGRVEGGGGEMGGGGGGNRGGGQGGSTR